MKLHLNHFSLAVAAALALSVTSGHAQDVMVTGTLTDVPAGGGVYDYTLSLNVGAGSEAVQALWLGWFAFGFDIANPTAASGPAGWPASVVGDSIQFGPGTAIMAGNSGIFHFDSTSTPAEFQAGTAGLSVAYGVDDSPFALHNTTLHSEEFTPTVVPEPSSFGLLAIGSLGFLGALGRKLRGN